MDALDGRVIVIVGGTSGIGLSAARACVAAGGRVLVVGLAPPTGLAAELGPAGRVFEGDARDPETARSAVRQAAGELGGSTGSFTWRGARAGRSATGRSTS